MSEYGRRRWGSAALGLGGLILLTLSPTRAAAQGPSPVIIPGLPGASLQAGARPSLNAWPYTDLPGGKAMIKSDSGRRRPSTWSSRRPDNRHDRRRFIVKHTIGP
jgi:hypothetical protein